MHYRNSVLYRVLLFSEFYGSAMQIPLPFDENWLRGVLTVFGHYTLWWFYVSVL